jgi:hypothetical protein
VGNKPKRCQTRHLGPRCIFFSFFYVYFLFICPIMAICQPPATCFNPQLCFLTIWPCLSTPATCFHHPSTFSSTPGPETRVRAIVCMFFIFFFFGFENVCMSNCTHVSYLFSFFFSFSSPRNACMSNCTHVSYLFSFFFLLSSSKCMYE